MFRYRRPDRFIGASQIAATRQQTKAQVAAYTAQAEAANQNARIADKQREQLSDKYLEEQKQLDNRRRLAIGQHAAEAGASGFTNTGSVQDMDASTIDQWRSDSMNLLGNQRNDTKSAYINQVNYINQANAAKASAQNAKAQGRAAMFGTILSTAASMYGSIKNASSAGTSGSSGTQITSPARTYTVVGLASAPEHGRRIIHINSNLKEAFSKNEALPILPLK